MRAVYCAPRPNLGFLVHARASPTRSKGGVSPATLAVDATGQSSTCLCRLRAGSLSLEQRLEADRQARREVTQLAESEQDTWGEGVARVRVVADAQRLPVAAE